MFIRYVARSSCLEGQTILKFWNALVTYYDANKMLLGRMIWKKLKFVMGIIFMFLSEDVGVGVWGGSAFA